MNHLYYGDNLLVLRDSIAAESVDLIYLDPPFNSKRDYNLLFKSPKGHASEAQIEAFKDTWHWGKQAEREFDELLHQPNTAVAEMMKSFLSFVGRNDMMAYLTMMANRLLVMHGVLKPAGSLYLHCDPVASHYLKLLLDAVFGKECFNTEIIWKRTTSHGNVGRTYGDCSDTIFFYHKSPDYCWNQLHQPMAEEYIEDRFTGKDPDGRRWQSVTLRNPGSRPNLHYPFTASNGVTYEPHPNGWSCDLKRMKKYDAEKRLHFPRPGGQLRLKMYLDESPGIKLQNLWTDIPPINSQAQERLGYPTQKPLALLERIISASSNPNDLVLDPFCGCGTAVHAAQKLKRKWIGIDITHLAISLIEKRLKDAFGTRCKFEVHGTPNDLESARDLAARDKYQFQWWAVSLVEAQPFQGKKKGADTGIDGLKFFRDLDKREVRKIIINVKGGENVGPAMVKDLIATVAREKAEIGLFLTLAEPTKAMSTEAVAAGFYESATGKKYPRLQILTIAALLGGTARAEHPDYEPDLNFKKAKAEAHGEQSELL